MISSDRIYVEYEKLYAECEELEKIKENAIKAFQVLWAETHTETAWSAHIFAQNMLLHYFGGQKAFNEAKKKRKEFINTTCFKGEALDLFVTELEQELKDYKKKYANLQDAKVILDEKYKEVLEVLKDRNQKLDRFKQALKPFNDEYFKDLDTQTIAELAKKSIRLTRENRKLEEALDEIERYIRDELIDEFGNQVYLFNREKVLGIINKADFRTDAAPESEDIEPTKPERLSGETVRAQRKSKTAREVCNEDT